VSGGPCALEWWPLCGRVLLPRGSCRRVGGGELVIVNNNKLRALANGVGHLLPRPLCELATGGSQLLPFQDVNCGITQLLDEPLCGGTRRGPTCADPTSPAAAASGASHWKVTKMPRSLLSGWAVAADRQCRDAGHAPNPSPTACAEVCYLRRVGGGGVLAGSDALAASTAQPLSSQYWATSAGTSVIVSPARYVWPSWTIWCGPSATVTLVRWAQDGLCGAVMTAASSRWPAPPTGG